MKYPAGFVLVFTEVKTIEFTVAFNSFHKIY